MHHAFDEGSIVHSLSFAVHDSICCHAFDEGSIVHSLSWYAVVFARRPRTHARTHARMLARTHARAHARTHARDGLTVTDH